MDTQTNNDAPVGNTNELPQDPSGILGQTEGSVGESSDADVDTTLGDGEPSPKIGGGFIDEDTDATLGDGEPSPKIGGGFIDEDTDATLGDGEPSPKIGGGFIDEDADATLGDGQPSPKIGGTNPPPAQ